MVATALNTGVYHTTDERSDKHELLLSNCSAQAKAANGSDTKSLEVSTGIGQIFPFCRQDSAFIPNVQARIDLTINENFAKDMFYTEQLRGTAIPENAIRLKQTWDFQSALLLWAIP